jgi:hypothetical protein
MYNVYQMCDYKTIITFAFNELTMSHVHPVSGINYFDYHNILYIYII